MEYLYEQQPKPTNATGVTVTLTALDPNGNYQTIGQTTSDASGQYAFMWTPPVPGVYSITATFSGSNSYYSSSAETNIGVGEASATTAPTSTANSDLASAMNTQLYIVAAGMIAVIVIVLVAAIAIFRKIK